MNTKTEGLLQQRLVDVIYGPGNERSEPVEELVEALISIAISSLAASSRRTPIESNTEPVAWIPQAHLDFLKMGVDGDGPSSAIVHDRPNEEMGWTIPLYLAAPVSVAPAVTDAMVNAALCAQPFGQLTAGECLLYGRGTPNPEAFMRAAIESAIAALEFPQ